MALILLLGAAFLIRSRTGISLRNRAVKTEKRVDDGPTPATLQDPSMPIEVSKPRSSNGTLEVQFELDFNTELYVVVWKDNAIEKTHPVRLVADPRTDPRNYTPRTLAIEALPPGPRRVLVLSTEGFIEKKLDVTIVEGECARVIVRFERNPYEKLARLEGRILDRQGKPLQGARVTLKTEDPERIVPGPTEVITLLDLEMGFSSSRRDGCGEEPAPYSEDYLERALKPLSYSTAQFWIGTRAFSDGNVTMHNVTAESGTFIFTVASPRPHPVSVQYAGIEQTAVVSPSQPLDITMPVDPLDQRRYEDYYRLAMQAMPLKDAQASRELLAILESIVQGKKNSAVTCDLLKEFETTSCMQFDFHDKDLPRRNAFITKARHLADQLSLVLSRDHE